MISGYYVLDSLEHTWDVDFIAAPSAGFKIRADGLMFPTMLCLGIFQSTT